MATLEKRYVVKLFSGIAAGFTGLIIVAIVPNALGPLAFGQFSFISQIFSQIYAFLDGGTSTAFFTKISAKKSRVELIKYYSLVSILVLTISYAGVKLVHFYGFGEMVFSDVEIKYIYQGLLFGFLLWFTQVYIKISDAYVLTISVEVIRIVHRILSLGFLVLLISYPNFNLSKYFLYNIISLLAFIGFISVVFIKKGIITQKVVLARVKYLHLTREFYNYASPLFVFNSLSIIVAIFDIWLLQYVSGSIQTGFYGIAFSIAAMCFLFTGAMTQIIAREFSKSYSENEIENIKNLFKKYTPILYALAAYFGVFLSFQSDILLKIFIGEDFMGAYIVLMIMAFYPLHQTYGQLNGSLFFSTENTRRYRDTSLISMFIGMSFSYIFIYQFEMGAIGFAWKMVLGQIIGVNLQLFYITRFLKLRLGYFLVHQIVVLLFFVTAAYLASWLPWSKGGTSIHLFFDGISYSLIVVTGTILFPSILGVTRDEVFKNFHKRKRKT